MAKGRLVLPEPPSANRYWRVWRNRAVLSDEGRSYRFQVRAAVGRPSDHGWPLEGPVAVTLAWYRGRQAGDLDNRTKPVLDALNGVAYRDDRQVTAIIATRHEDPSHPRIEVTIQAVE